MGMFDGILGGVVGAEMATAVNHLIEKQGGIQGIASQFEKQGLGATVKSWIGTGPNQTITPDQLHSVLGSDAVSSLSAKTGIPVADLLGKLSAALPQVIDKMTPNGAVPPG